jgi:hypothetical protein
VPAPNPAPSDRPADRPVLPPPTPREIWVRSLVIGAVAALFIAVAFGRFESDRMIPLFIGWAVPLVLAFGLLFTFLNRPRDGRR